MLAQLMQVDFLPKPIASSYQVRLQATSDSNAIDQLPALQAQQQLADVANKQGRVYRAAMHPSFSVGYSNMSAIGFQNITGMEKYYSARDRLSTVQLGIGIPFFNQANKARVQSAQQEAQAAQLHYQNLRWQKQQEWNSLRQLAEEQDKSMQYYQAVALPQAQTIFTEASKQFQQGAISYLEWQQLMQQSIHIRMQFLQAAELRNETAIRIYFLTHSK
jgi:cobalt-zinc-cadmium resistance protein CzcA